MLTRVHPSERASAATSEQPQAIATIAGDMSRENAPPVVVRCAPKGFATGSSNASSINTEPVGRRSEDNVLPINIYSCVYACSPTSGHPRAAEAVVVMLLTVAAQLFIAAVILDQSAQNATGFSSGLELIAGILLAVIVTVSHMRSDVLPCCKFATYLMSFGRSWTKWLLVAIYYVVCVIITVASIFLVLSVESAPLSLLAAAGGILLAQLDDIIFGLWQRDGSATKLSRGLFTRLCCCGCFDETRTKVAEDAEAPAAVVVSLPSLRLDQNVEDAATAAKQRKVAKWLPRILVFLYIAIAIFAIAVAVYTGMAIDDEDITDSKDGK
ncbi:hypothetical protein Agub_g10374 [Astrephomene gubernaculifera]|uniref:Transmembrane protein n=1 Tax=Astrephomene gubernaculifera TaxID=47775 RepID=A0AAD3DV88_9CHLO|nr:hypothetical protein Agub_g10374 [Astrephomene gubernaculifera]